MVGGYLGNRVGAPEFRCERVERCLAAQMGSSQTPESRASVAFDLGDVILLRPPGSSQRALAVVVAHNDGYPRGTVNPVVELLAWDGASMPTRKQMQSMPTVMHRNNLMDKEESYLRPHLYIICTWRKERAFSSEFGEIVERGVLREPSGSHRRTDAFSEVGASSWEWSGLCLYLDQEYADELRQSLEASRKRRLPRMLRRG